MKKTKKIETAAEVSAFTWDFVDLSWDLDPDFFRYSDEIWEDFRRSYEEFQLDFSDLETISGGFPAENRRDPDKSRRKAGGFPAK